MNISAIASVLLDLLKTSELTKSLIKQNPKRVFKVISQHPDLILNTTSGTKEVLTLLMEVDQTSFIKMAVELKTSEFGNIMHSIANERMIDFAKDLIGKIQNHYDAMTVTNLMFLRNFVMENSPIMAMISKMYNEEDKIISIWTMIFNEVPYSCEQEHILLVAFLGSKHLQDHSFLNRRTSAICILKNKSCFVIDTP